MAFRNLEARFQAKMNDLYGYASTRDQGSLGDRGNEPYLEYKPNDPNRNETKNDSRFLPIGSTKRDVKRIGKFLLSGRGLLFLGSQQLLQTGNAFAETRVLNPFFVVANLQPYKHFSRVLTSAKDFDVKTKNDSERATISPRSAGLGAAGRMQKSTADNAIVRATGINGGKSGLASLLSATKLGAALTSVFSVAKSGATGVNGRPELTINSNEYYSVLMWQGFIKQGDTRSNLATAQSQLRSGNFKSALKSLNKAFNTFINGTTNTGTGTSPLSVELRNAPAYDIQVAGRRYFITNATDADRYLINSVTADGKPNLTMLNRRAAAIESEHYEQPQTFGGPLVPNGGIPVEERAFEKNIQRSNQEVRQTEADTVRSVKQGARGFFAGLGNGVIDGFRRGQSGTDAATSITKAQSLPAATTDRSVEDDGLLFPGLSLKQRYSGSDSSVAHITEALATQKERSFAYWKRTTENSDRGFVQGLAPGYDVDPKVTLSGAPRYLTDKMNLQALFDEDPSETSVSPRTMEQIQKGVGRDMIDVIFFDFVQKKTIPFRAYITNITENVTPEVSDTRYIGRIERNVVYVGVSRELSFQLRIHAMSDREMQGVWTKINYMTGLCYPSAYISGFMVPPFIKLTIGDVYRDQPGYIKSLTHTIEDGTSWETSAGYQAPQGMLMNMTFAVIEKTQMQSNSNFYPFGPKPKELLNFFSAAAGALT